MEVKVDLLNKEELKFEIISRGRELEDNVTVTELRKILRELVRLKIKPCAANLRGRYSLLEEWKLTVEAVRDLTGRTERAVGESSAAEIARCEAKIAHYNRKIAMLHEVGPLEGKHVEVYNNLVENMGELYDKIVNSEVSEEDKLHFSRRLSENNEAEENLECELAALQVSKESNSVFMPSTVTVSAPMPQQTQFGLPLTTSVAVNAPVNYPGMCNVGAPSNVTFNEHRPHEPINQLPMFSSTNAFNPVAHRSMYESPVSNLYSKLPNPIERHLKLLKSTDGLNAHSVLDFIKVMLQLSKESGLDDRCIIELMLSYTVGPLYNKMLVARRNNLSVVQVHDLLLDTFVPLGMREQFKMTMVHRVQGSDEALAVYVQSIKDSAVLLRCLYSEKQLVDLIKMGINPAVRNQLTFCKTINSFDDLDEACIEVQNINFSDAQRNCLSAPVVSRQAPVDFKRNTNIRPNYPQRNNAVYKPQINSRSFTVDNRKCFKCNQPGHLANQCRVVKTTSNVMATRQTKN